MRYQRVASDTFDAAAAAGQVVLDYIVLDRRSRVAAAVDAAAEPRKLGLAPDDCVRGDIVVGDDRRRTDAHYSCAAEPSYVRINQVVGNRGSRVNAVDTSTPIDVSVLDDSVV